MASFKKIEIKKIKGFDEGLKKESVNHLSCLTKVFENNSQIFIPTILKISDDEYFILNLFDEFNAFKRGGNQEVFCLVIDDLKGIDKESLVILFQNIASKYNAIKISEKIIAIDIDAQTLSNKIGVPIAVMKFYKELFTFDWDMVTTAEKVEVSIPEQASIFDFIDEEL